MKKILTIVLVLAVALFTLTGCSSSSSSTSSGSTFNNKYGTATTKCAHSGCNNYVASSGDTNCCAAHSNKCLECGKYIDGDAMYCMSCLTNAVNNASSGNGKSSSYSNNNSTSSGSTFNNKYGTATTKCAHPGCNNNVASSGDTNCCAAHSNKCLECGKYIDGDAMYCMSCLTNAVNDVSSGNGNSYSYSNNNSGGKSNGTGAGGYDMPNENDKSFADYVKRVDPELYDSLFGK